jgi:chromosome segregation ATPase
MAFEKVKADFHRLSEQRSDILKQIKKCENDILSITERLEELSKTDDQSQEFVDQYSKAKDKRRRLRDEVADLEHSVRMVEAEITAIMMEYQFVVDFEEVSKNAN